MNDSNPAWDLFAALQGEADPQSTDRSFARDEALDVVVDEIVSDRLTDRAFLQKRYYSLCRNRLSKQKNRRALDRRRLRDTHRRGGSEFGSVLLSAPTRTILNDLAYNQLADLIRSLLPEEDFELLLEIADGTSYAHLARGRNATVASLKSRAFRIREKIRLSRIAATLRHGLSDREGR